jgi:hypothetical protein
MSLEADIWVNALSSICPAMVMRRGLSRLTDIALGATIGAEIVGN